MSFNYPVIPTNVDKQNYRAFILGLKYVLPCGKCRTNLCTNFKKMPFLVKYMKNRDTFSKYIFDLHELINTMLNKKSGLTYKQVRDRYEHFRARCNNKKTRKNKMVQIHDGCNEPVYGEKTKCVLQIVPISNTTTNTY
jgi:hypothetical protein